MGAGDRHPVIDESGNVIGDYVKEVPPKWFTEQSDAEFEQVRGQIRAQMMIGARLVDPQNAFRGLSAQC